MSAQSILIVWSRASLGLKPMACIKFFEFLIYGLDGFFRSMSQMKPYNFLNSRKIAIQHLNNFVTVKSAQTWAETF